jgi:hypothetical protein
MLDLSECFEDETETDKTDLDFTISHKQKLSNSQLDLIKNMRSAEATKIRHDNTHKNGKAKILYSGAFK